MECALSMGERGYAVVVPTYLKPILLRLEHYPKTAGHLGGRKMYQTLMKRFYWPGMTISCYQTVRILRRRANLSPRKIKPASFVPSERPLEDVAIDILCQLHTSGRGKKKLLLIVDRFTKLVLEVHMKGTNTFKIAKDFTKHWAFVYGILKSVLTDDGPKFRAKFLAQTHQFFGFKPQLTTTYHRRVKGETELLNRTILASLRLFMTDHLKYWDL